MMKISIPHCLFLFLSVSLFGQGGLEAFYSFDGCSPEDKTGQYADVVLAGNPACSCGAVNDAMGPAQLGDVLELDGELGEVLSGDFTLSFYIKNLQPSGSNLLEIMSNELSCLQDSTFTVQYDQISRNIVFRLNINPSNQILLKGPLPDDQCWNHVVLTRDNVTFTLYVNAAEVDVFVYERGLVIPVRTDNPFRIGQSVCNVPPFIGRVDELQFYSKPLSIKEVSALYQPVNRILSPDTILVQGDQMIPEVYVRCQTSVTWSPSTGVSDRNSLQPALSPQESTIYTLQIDEGDCITLDSLTIQVVDPGDVQCQNLYLPTAFTPNGDNVNDRFGISNFYIIETLDYFDVFDKWGGVVFHTNDKNHRWDGNFNGKALNPGIYSYKIAYVCGGKTYLKTGAFNILR